MENKKERFLLHELPSGKYREATEQEKEIALEAEKERKKLYEGVQKYKDYISLLENCTHPVCWDEEGYIYHARHCIICGDISIL